MHVTEESSPPESTYDLSPQPSEFPSGGSTLSWSFRVPRNILGVLGVYVASRLVILFAAYYGRSVSHAASLGSLFSSWDAGHYMDIATNGYPVHPDVTQYSNVAFFPGYPMLTRAVATLTGFSALTAGVIIAWVAGAVFVVLVTALVARAFDSEAGQRAGILLAVFPGAYIATIAYAESLATMFVAASLWAMARDRPYRAGAMAALATFTSPVTLPIGVTLLWRAWRRHDVRYVLSAAIAGIGFASYMVFLWIHTGSLLTWYRAEHEGFHVYYSVLSPIAPLHYWPGLGLTETLSLLVLAAAVVGSIRSKVPSEWMIFGILVAAGSMFDKALWLNPRILYNAFPLLMGLAVWLRREWYRVVAYTFAALLPVVFLLYLTLGNVTAQP